MRSLAKALTGITVVIVLLFIYILYSARLHVVLVDVSVQSASEQETIFRNVQASAARGEAGITIFDSDFNRSADQYDFISLTYEITNFGLFPAEWLDLNVIPGAGDQLQVSELLPDISGLRKARLTTVILTQKGGANIERAAELEYYVLGRQQQVGITP